MFVVLLWALVLVGVGVVFFRWLLEPPDPSINLPPPPPTVDHTTRVGLAKEALRLAPKTGLRYLVIGTGSVGTAIAEALLERGEKHVKGFDVAPSPSLEGRIPLLRGSVSELSDLEAACEGVDVVYATFALIRYYERLKFQYSDSHNVNVLGTANVIAACKAKGCRVLITTSTSHVCVAPEMVKLNMTEDSPYVDAKSCPNHYGYTKVQAERLVLAASGPGLATGSIRPCSGIFGPADKIITQRYLDQGSTLLIAADPYLDYVYVENVVWGHLLLERALLDKPKAVGGQAFCISNEEPMTSGDFCAKLRHYYEKQVGSPMAVTYLPPRLMGLISYQIEAIQWLTGGAIKGDGALLTPAMLQTARISYTFTSKRAGEVLGYKPLYTVDEALQRTVQFWAEEKKGKK